MVVGTTHVTVQFSTPREITGWSMRWSTFSGYAWTSGKLQYSDDGSSFTDSVTFAPANSTATQYFTGGGGAGTHDYWRLLANGAPHGGAGNGMACDEIEMAEGPRQALCHDVSGNDNHFVSAGTITQATDSPTDDAENDGGNFARWNQLDNVGVAVVSNGGLTLVTDSAYDGPICATIAVDAAEDHSWEILISAGSFAMPGIIKTTDARTSATAELGSTANAYAYRQDNGNIRNNGGDSAYGATFTTGDRITVRLHAGSLTFYKNNVSQGVAATGLTGMFFPAFSDFTFSGTSTITANFGATAFAYAMPGTAKRICTANLPAPATAASVTPLTGSVTCNGTTNNAFVWLGYTPDTAGSSTLGGSGLTWGTHAIPTAGGFKIISASFNGSVAYSIAVARPFGGEGVSQARAQ